MLVGSYHVKATWVVLVFALSLAKLKGALGTVGVSGIIAPAPTVDSAESPIALIAIIFALTDVPVVKLNGEALSLDTRIVHDLLEITDEVLMPSQDVVS